MKKKVVLLALLLIVVATGAVWVVKAAFMPSASAEAVARDFLIQYYSIPSHDFYAQHSQPSSLQSPSEANTEKFGRFLTDDYLKEFLSNLGGDRWQAWAANNGYLLAIGKLDVQPTSSDAKGTTTYLQYDVTLTVTRESDKRLATFKQSGRINVDKVNGGYRVSAWQIDNERKMYQENLFP